jgi:hypothetical protein
MAKRCVVEHVETRDKQELLTRCRCLPRVATVIHSLVSQSFVCVYTIRSLCLLSCILQACMRLALRECIEVTLQGVVQGQRVGARCVAGRVL